MFSRVVRQELRWRARSRISRLGGLSAMASHGVQPLLAVNRFLRWEKASLGTVRIGGALVRRVVAKCHPRDSDVARRHALVV